MAVFEFKNAQEVGRVCRHHGIKYLFCGKSGAIVLGVSDTSQDVDLYVEKQAVNCGNLVDALVDLGFRLTEEEQGSGASKNMASRSFREWLQRNQ